MKKTIGFAILGLIALPALISAPANAQSAKMLADNKIYMSGSVGWLIPEDTSGTVSNTPVTVEHESGYQVNFAIGTHLPNNFRAEAELGYGSTSYDKIKGNNATAELDGDVDLFTATLNGFYDIPTGTMVTPYVGGGLGLAYIDTGRITATLGGTSVSASGDSSTDLLVLGEVGAAIKIDEALSVVPAYRYSWIDSGANGLDDDSAHTVKVGLRYVW